MNLCISSRTPYWVDVIPRAKSLSKCHCCDTEFRKEMCRSTPFLVLPRMREEEINLCPVCFQATRLNETKVQNQGYVLFFDSLHQDDVSRFFYAMSALALEAKSNGDKDKLVAVKNKVQDFIQSGSLNTLKSFPNLQKRIASQIKKKTGKEPSEAVLKRQLTKPGFWGAQFSLLNDDDFMNLATVFPLTPVFFPALGSYLNEVKVVKC